MQVKCFNELSFDEVKSIAESNYNYWKKFNPNLNYEQSLLPFLQMRENIDKLPVGIALLDDKNIVGFCTLRENRLEKYLDINPWICNVFVFDEYRNKGFGTKLIDEACKKLKKLGYNIAYVWTDQALKFYEKLGFVFEGKVEKNEGGQADLFSKELKERG